MEREQVLPIVLRVLGVVFIVGVYPLMMVWPSGWRWEPNQHEYEQMIIVLYATLGVFLVLASRDPVEHRSLLQFTVWSSLAHAAVMTLHALAEADERGHLVGDIPALLLVAGVLSFLMPAQKTRAEPRPSSRRP